MTTARTYTIRRQSDMDRSYVAENDRERARLRALVERLNDEELSRPMEDGWTIAATLSHLAFWDARAVSLINKWEGGIAPSAADHEPENVDQFNEAAMALGLALAPRAAARLALEQAEEADRRVAALSDDLIARFMAAGQPFYLARANHRKLHLDDIERYLLG
jgi:hypothetical protein